MKKFNSIVIFLAAFLLFLPAKAIPVQAKGSDTIKTGIYVGNMELSGKTKEDARQSVETYVASLKEKEITFLATDGNEVTVTAGDIGLEWANKEIIEEAAALGTEGNVVQRYKAITDLQRENKVYKIAFSVDEEIIHTLIEEKCTRFDKGVKNFSLVRENDQFRVVEGEAGYGVDVEASAAAVVSYMEGEWNHESVQIPLEIGVIEPEGSAKELSKIKDILGTCTTSFSSSGSARSANVTNGSNLINGTTIYPGEEFSTYEAIAPFTADNGYYPAGSYLNGQVVDSIGGGICQVSTTLYGAVLQAELEVTERHNHSMIVNYVEPSADAAIAESAGKDFRFVNNLDYPIYIEGIVTTDKKLTFNIYGLEDRAAERTVTYESVVLSVTNPDTEVIYTDAAQPVGFVSAVQSAHIGYKAQLWKVVTVNGVEESRTQINSSSYKMTPRSVTIGVATENPDIYNQLMAAVGTSSIDYVRAVAAALSTGAEVPAAPTAPEPEQPEQPQEPADVPADVPADSGAVQLPEGEVPPI